MTYQKTCVMCGNPFETIHDTSETCSRRCASLLRYQRIKQRTVQALIDKYIKPMDHVKYAGGYTNSRGSVCLHCDKWDEDFTILVSDLRKPGITTCSVCWKHRADVILRVHGRSRGLVAKHPTHSHYGMLHWVQCLWCGSMFLSSSSLSCYCSSQCRHQQRLSYDTMKKTRRYERAHRNGKYEVISLVRLYKRDHGICYLCGKHLYLTDDYNRKSAPTIEHVIPICKGGTNSWDNVRLACRDCNVKKGKKILSPGAI